MSDESSIRKKVIEEILLWRRENRGKNLGYCTNGLIEDVFLEELMGVDCWTPQERDNRIRDTVIEEAINEITSQLNDKDRYWKGMQKSIEILKSLRGYVK